MFWETYVGLCNKVGKSPNAVAAACGVKSSGTVTGWSKGATPRRPVLKKIADYFGVTVEYLSGEAEEQKEKPGQSNLAGLSEEKQQLIKVILEMTDERAAALLRALNE